MDQFNDLTNNNKEYELYSVIIHKSEKIFHVIVDTDTIQVAHHLNANMELEPTISQYIRNAPVNKSYTFIYRSISQYNKKSWLERFDHYDLMRLLRSVQSPL